MATSASVHRIGRHAVEIACPEGIGPVTPYSLLLAGCIADLAGATVVDLGCGSGMLGIVALLQGAAGVHAIDIDPHACAATRDNARRNGVAERLFVVRGGEEILPLPVGMRVEIVPNHVCMAFAMLRRASVVRDGVVIDRWEGFGPGSSE